MIYAYKAEENKLTDLFGIGMAAPAKFVRRQPSGGVIEFGESPEDRKQEPVKLSFKGTMLRDEIKVTDVSRKQTRPMLANGRTIALPRVAAGEEERRDS
jgi:hypothetical protein